MLAKRDYNNKRFNKHLKNFKMTWKAINDTLNRHKTKSRVPETFKQSNGKIISDPKEIATAFNDYVISIGEMSAVTRYKIQDTRFFISGKLPIVHDYIQCLIKC